jgi:hypothetical protein
MSLWCSKLTNNWGSENSQFPWFEPRLLPNKRDLLCVTYQCNCLLAYLLYGHQEWIHFNVEVEYRLFSHYIQDVKKYMLNRSVVYRWVQSDHILLIHPCPETLPFGTKGHKSSREAEWVIGEVVVVLHYKSYSKWRPPTSLHFLHRLTMLCWTLWKIPGISRMVPAATAILATRSCCVSTEYHTPGQVIGSSMMAPRHTALMSYVSIWMKPFATDGLDVQPQ